MVAVNGILFGIVTFFSFLLLCGNLYTNAQHIYYPHCYIKPILDIRVAMLPLKLIGNLVAKSLLELFSNKVYKEF